MLTFSRKSNQSVWIGAAKVIVEITAAPNRCKLHIDAPESIKIMRGELILDADRWRGAQTGPYRVQVDAVGRWLHHSVHNEISAANQLAEHLVAEGGTARVVDCYEQTVYTPQAEPDCDMCEDAKMVICGTCSGTGTNGNNLPDDNGPHHICATCDGDGDIVCPQCRGCTS